MEYLIIQENILLIIILKRQFLLKRSFLVFRILDKSELLK